MSEKGGENTEKPIENECGNMSGTMPARKHYPKNYKSKIPWSF